MKDGTDRDSSANNSKAALDSVRKRGSSVEPDPRPFPAIDFAEFAMYFEGENITEEEARAFLDEFWMMSLEIMSMDFSTHPVQLALMMCGKPRRPLSKPTREPANPVCLSDRKIAGNFERAATRVSGGNAKGAANE